MQILLVSGDAPISSHLEKILLKDEKVNVTIAEVVCFEKDLLTNYRHTDFVFLDIHLLKTNRIEHLKEIRRALPYANILIVTPYYLESEAIELTKHGADGFLTKTYDYQAWQSCVFQPRYDLTLLENYFLTYIVPQILNTKVNERELDGNYNLEREWKIIKLKEKGYNAKEIAAQLNCSLEEIAHHIAIIEKTLGRHLSA